MGGELFDASEAMKGRGRTALRGRQIVAVFLFLAASCFGAQAHIGSPNVLVEGKAGEYAVHVVIRPPNVVPGLAQISVRAEGQGIERVTVLPVFWNARKGTPPPDEAKLIRGETNLYAAELWLMKPGSYSVDVTVEGRSGKGTLVVPVNAAATNTRPMARGVAVVLAGLTLVLFFGGLGIARAVFCESRLEPGGVPTTRDRWRGRGGMAVATVVLLLMLFGGRKWWDFEDRNYRNNSLYKPTPIATEMRSEKGQHLLRLRVETDERQGGWTPLIPDHGKIMHLFMVGEASRAFAHLHPARRSDTEFETALPPLPSGTYHVYADVTHENGFSETLTNQVQLPAPSIEMKRLWLGNSTEPICSAELAQMLATKLAVPPDIDDSWQVDLSEPARLAQDERSPKAAEITGGYKMLWQSEGPLIANREVLLRFRLIMPDSRPAPLDPYMGMLGHAIVRREDGTVFAHIHPAGTFSIAAQEFFSGARGQQGKEESGQGQLHPAHSSEPGSGEELMFPYAFPQPGTYRVWVQTKSQGRIMTGAFVAKVVAD
jgi:hypothetical protein